MTPFNGVGMHLGNLARLSRARTRSISPENFTGEKGRGGMATDGTGAACARDLGVGWKIAVHPHRSRRNANTCRCARFRRHSAYLDDIDRSLAP